MENCISPQVASAVIKDYFKIQSSLKYLNKRFWDEYSEEQRAGTLLNIQIFYENIEKFKNIIGAALIIYHNEHSPGKLKFQLLPSNLDIKLHYWLEPDCPSTSRLIERHSTCCQ